MVMTGEREELENLRARCRVLEAELGSALSELTEAQFKLLEKDPGSVTAVLEACRLICGEAPRWLPRERQWSIPSFVHFGRNDQVHLRRAVLRIVLWLDRYAFGLEVKEDAELEQARLDSLVPHRGPIRRIGKDLAKWDGDAWVKPDGSKWWFCDGPACPGLRWKASWGPHPSTCNEQKEGTP